MKGFFLLLPSPSWNDASKTENPEITQAENGIPDTSVDSALPQIKTQGLDKWLPTHLG